jgi:hypothetical protein
MPVVQSGLPSLSVTGHKLTGYKTQGHLSHGKPQKVRQDHPFTELGDPPPPRRTERAGRWIDIAAACAITFSLCAWIAIHIAASI